MDLPAILARAPELCLIDELAHTNAPGVEHEKRYEDIETCSTPGSTCSRPSTSSTSRASTTRSRADRHARARDDPRRVLGEADEVVLIDITPSR
jgi:two-component system sensor histidine kinase KdpD